MLSSLLQIARLTLMSLLGALLPAPERDRLADRIGVNLPFASLVLGFVQLVAGFAVFFMGWLTFMGVSVGAGIEILLENSFPELSSVHIRGLGMVSTIAWCLHPLAWVSGAVALTGLLRIIAWTVAREALAEPAVWAGLRLAQGVAALRRRHLRERELGPVRPDRIETRRDGGIVVVTCREKPGWNEAVTIEVGGRFYRLDGLEERRDGPWHALAYRLVKIDGPEVFRGLVHHEDPAAAG